MPVFNLFSSIFCYNFFVAKQVAVLPPEPRSTHLSVRSKERAKSKAFPEGNMG